MRRRTVLTLASAIALAPAVPAQAHPGHTVPTTPTLPPAGSGAAYGSGWEPLAPIAGGPRQEHSVAAVGGRIYVMGGILPNPAGGVTTTDRVEVYDPRHDSWSQAAPLPVAMNHPNVAAVGGRLYVLGGLSGGASWQALRDSFVYDPRTDRWTTLPPVPAGTERGSAAMGVRGTRIYLAGGMRTLTPGPGGLQDTVATVSSYDVVTGRWATLPSLPEARDHVGGAIVGGTFYVLGGRDRGQVNVRDTVYALDLNSGRWTRRAPMPTPRGGIASAVVGDRIYTFGGEGNPAEGSNSIFAENEVYDTRNDRWHRLAPMPRPRHGTAAVAVGGTIYIPGGGNLGGGAPVDVNDAYRPTPRR
ncbi:kelch repeat-containing protein [Plantactinospora mayteni]|uniref:Ring canal kelch-like protein n=1 Tax=Plantactinospora mayteni TaxID=566021 RepID=A0ABQ4F3E9_9ACTN|nr:kelch repeat-containing protein [Plantactinospora mayteni]GIH01428.1 ring canal kelch-like protein [Plantactinospora mayteni]